MGKWIQNIENINPQQTNNSNNNKITPKQLQEAKEVTVGVKKPQQR